MPEERQPPFRFRGFSVPSYTMCPDELFDELLAVLSGSQLKVTMYVIRRTFGFKKSSDNISISQMLYGIKTKDGRQLDRGTGLSKSTLLQAVRELTEMEVIIPERRESPERGNEATCYRLNLIGIQPSAPTPPDDKNGPPGGTGEQPPLVRKLDQGVSGNQTKPLVGKSDPQDTVKQQTDKVVNALPTNDRKKPSERGKSAPAISDRALRAKYGLTDEQLGQVHYLVERQASLLGSVERNHAHYVKRAAEAVAAGDGQILDAKLGDFKQAATALTVGLAPAYFHTMWKEETERRRRQVATKASTEKIGRGPEAPADDRIGRMIENAERRGVPVPEHIRRSLNYQQVARWWASLDASET